jgi:hypothetical protein
VATYFDDFSSYSTGSLPTGYTKRFETGSTITVETATGATGGKALRIVNASGFTRPQGVSRDDVDSDADRANCEAVFRWRWLSSGVDVIVGAFGRGSGTATQGNYYGTSDNTSSSLKRLVERNTGTLTTHGSAAKTFSLNTWYWTRYRSNGTTHTARTWDDGSSEPGTWDYSVTDSTISAAGWVGVVSGALNNTGSFEVDVLGIGTNGDAAPNSGASSAGSLLGGLINNRRLLGGLVR